MKIKAGSQTADDAMQRIIDGAIEAAFGNVDALPPEVGARLRDVYREFIPVYLEIIRAKDGHPADWLPQQIVFDPEVVEDMRHFFSDYQDLARSFKRINHQVQNLLKIDRQADPHRFERCVADIVSGSQGAWIMDSIVGR